MHALCQRNEWIAGKPSRSFLSKLKIQLEKHADTLSIKNRTLTVLMYNGTFARADCTPSMFAVPSGALHANDGVSYVHSFANHFIKKKKQ